MYGHGPVTVISKEKPLYVCLDCGYVAHDNRLFAHEECERKDNPIGQTWREYLDLNEHDGVLPEPDADEAWPITDE